MRLALGGDRPAADGPGVRGSAPVPPHVADRLTAAFGEPPTVEAAARFAEGDAGFTRGVGRHRLEVRVIFWPRPRMIPTGAAAAWGVPALPTTAALADPASRTKDIRGTGSTEDMTAAIIRGIEREELHAYA